MKFFRRQGIIFLMVCLGILSPALLVAQETRPVYLVSQPGQNDVWTMNMGIQTEALRLYVPTVFARKGKTINLSFDTPRVSLRSGQETVILQSDYGILVRYDVAISGVPPLPKADRSLTIRFTLAELGASEASDTETPASYALRQAILTGPYSRGRAWVQSIEFEENRFIVVVGLKR